MMNYKQFEIYQVNLNPTVGSEQRGIRPCVFIQSNIVSHLGHTTLVIPFTSKKTDKLYPYEVLVSASKDNGLSVDSKLKCNHIRVIDKQRVKEKIGILESKYWDQIFVALEAILDRWGNFR
ncbi:hypothetical protein A2335_00390 [Candidatus Peregrinibacteria bacterium RIFOXYB2_FULL_32_7]|nr:MAG: hypothetical protein A2335_00390 [Candidatus Peregrinibacteria bacterium RIFOXYB2_FULL_32_7]